jgi:phage shock protein PspC (stress-responsive transcriptional regulator)
MTPTTQPERRLNLTEWRRDSERRKIAGVCAGIASQFGLPVTAVRTGFVLSALPMFSGIGIALYLVLWFLMPASESSRSGLDRVVDAVSDLTGEPVRRRSRLSDEDIEAELYDDERSR